MSWPNRDGYYSFLMHLGPFGCITTVIFSENAILSKPGFRIEITWPLPEPTWCNLTEFLQFSIHPKVPRVYGKLQKLNKIAPGGLWKRPHFGVIFSETKIFFSKNHKNYKKIIRVTKKLKNYSLVPIFWYTGCFFFTGPPPKKLKTTAWYIYFDLCFVEPIIFLVFHIF